VKIDFGSRDGCVGIPNDQLRVILGSLRKKGLRLHWLEEEAPTANTGSETDSDPAMTLLMELSSEFIVSASPPCPNNMNDFFSSDQRRKLELSPVDDQYLPSSAIGPKEDKQQSDP
jgi:hypothetical protein